MPTVDRLDNQAIGKQYGNLRQLTVIFTLRNDDGYATGRFMFCECSCGSVRRYRAANVINGSSTGCNLCRGKRSALKRTGENHWKYKHGSPPGITTYNSMLRRCGYRGLGSDERYYTDVTVCSRWLDAEHGFANFIEDMGPPPGPGYELDRIKSDKPYEKDNCQWLTKSEHSQKSCEKRWRGEM